MIDRVDILCRVKDELKNASDAINQYCRRIHRNGREFDFGFDDEDVQDGVEEGLQIVHRAGA